MPKTPEMARKHFEEALAYIATRYKDGISVSTWKDAAIKGEKTWKEAMQKAITEEARRKGIEKVSDEFWRERAINFGAPVIAERIRAALDKWEQNWTPKYRRVLSVRSGLPPRTLDFMQNIQNRLVPIVKAWKGQK